MSDLEDILDDPAAGTKAAEPSPPLGLAVRLARRGVHDLLRSLTVGRLHLQDPLGSWHFGALETAAHLPGAPEVSLRINDVSAYLDIATGGTIGAAEAYMAGKWTVSDLPAVMRLLAINREVMNRLESGMARLGGVLLKVAHWHHRNSRAGSRRNIHAHYDLGNELFQLFLDPTMMYSSAVFPRPETSLEEASL